jgi:hypothetical protein
VRKDDDVNTLSSHKLAPLTCANLHLPVRQKSHLSTKDMILVTLVVVLKSHIEFKKKHLWLGKVFGIELEN